MAKINIDTSEVRALAADMRGVAPRLGRDVRAVVRKGGTNITNQLRDEMSSSTYFKGVTAAISFDEIDGGYGVEVGPERGSPGSLANIAYFGGAYGGGGTVPDPQEALDAEADGFVRALADLAAGIL